ncbi:hypothetical protein [Litoribacter populi]|uniref:hypothetical protein n=1 Tax=Litoribacter populi TaxID=2598460 RepID=UPI00117CAF2B|nr:hypothetical protein [Litoribacter populi]
MNNSIAREVEAMRRACKDFFECDEDLCLEGQEVNFDIVESHSYSGGKITIGYKNGEELLFIKYQQNQLIKCKLYLMDLTDFSKSWGLVDKSQEQILKLHLDTTRTEESNQKEFIKGFEKWKAQSKAGIFMLAFSRFR